MIMEFTLNKSKAEALGYPVQSCYEVIDRIFAEYGIQPERLGFYRMPNNQASFDACNQVGDRLERTSWFLKVVEAWYWRVRSDDVADREDCLASYYRIQAMTL